ncbi:MAG TPA: TerC family protein [Chitinophagaceae bacterium]|nr:TerC family protein [Chitinophagaceae bacterium]
MANTWLWIGFNVFVLLMLALDLGVFNRKEQKVTFKEAISWSVVWVTLALIFNGWIYYDQGKDKALEFLTGYLIEKSLSVDNIFVFVLLFSFFKVPEQYRHRVLFWGVLGALLMRAGFIAAGAVLIEKFHWIIYVFGAFLVFTGYKMLNKKTEDMHPEDNPLVRWFVKKGKVTSDYHGKNFFVRINGQKLATPLFLCLLSVEFTDLIFAVDSIPAIFAITKDPFIVYTSNVFAILGLRSLYFALEGIITRFPYLRYGLALILIFIGLKMLAVDIYKIPVVASLAVIAVILLTSIFWKGKKQPG